MGEPPGQPRLVSRQIQTPGWPGSVEDPRPSGCFAKRSGRAQSNCQADAGGENAAYSAMFHEFLDRYTEQPSAWPSCGTVIVKRTEFPVFGSSRMGVAAEGEVPYGIKATPSTSRPETVTRGSGAGSGEINRRRPSIRVPDPVEVQRSMTM